MNRQSNPAGNNEMHSKIPSVFLRRPKPPDGPLTLAKPPCQERGSGAHQGPACDEFHPGPTSRLTKSPHFLYLPRIMSIMRLRYGHKLTHQFPWLPLALSKILNLCRRRLRNTLLGVLLGALQNMTSPAQVSTTRATPAGKLQTR